MADSQLTFEDLALEIARREGGAQEMNIAQIKECLRHTLDILCENRPSRVIELLESRAK